jgi:hypothetical protein
MLLLLIPEIILMHGIVEMNMFPMCGICKTRLFSIFDGNKEALNGL